MFFLHHKMVEYMRGMEYNYNRALKLFSEKLLPYMVDTIPPPPFSLHPINPPIHHSNTNRKDTTKLRLETEKMEHFFNFSWWQQWFSWTVGKFDKCNRKNNVNLTYGHMKMSWILSTYHTWCRHKVDSGVFGSAKWMNVDMKDMRAPLCLESKELWSFQMLEKRKIK